MSDLWEGNLVGPRTEIIGFLPISIIEFSEIREVCRRCFVTWDRCKLAFGETREMLVALALTPFACYRASLLGSVTCPTTFIINFCLLARTYLQLSPRGIARLSCAPLLDSTMSSVTIRRPTPLGLFDSTEFWVRKLRYLPAGCR